MYGGSFGWETSLFRVYFKTGTQEGGKVGGQGEDSSNEKWYLRLLVELNNSSVKIADQRSNDFSF